MTFSTVPRSCLRFFFGFGMDDSDVFATAAVIQFGAQWMGVFLLWRTLAYLKPQPILVHSVQLVPARRVHLQRIEAAYG